MSAVPPSTYITTYRVNGSVHNVCDICKKESITSKKDLLWRYPAAHCDRMYELRLCSPCYPTVANVTHGDTGAEAIKNATRNN